MDHPQEAIREPQKWGAQKEGRPQCRVATQALESVHTELFAVADPCKTVYSEVSLNFSVSQLVSPHRLLTPQKKCLAEGSSMQSRS